MSLARILIVEDEPKIARFVELELVHEGYEVDKAADGVEGVEAALSCDYDLILLDLLLPRLSGMEVLRRVRREKDTPVIVLTARDAVMDKVAGLDAGADDYITKPFAIEELLARVRLALRRKQPRAAEEAAPATHVIKAGRLAMDVDRHEVTVDSDTGGAPEVVELTSREFEVLRALLENKGIVMNRERLASLALGYDYLGETNIVDVYVRHLRSKIDDRFGIKTISTVRGVGYVIR